MAILIFWCLPCLLFWLSSVEGWYTKRSNLLIRPKFLTKREAVTSSSNPTETTIFSEDDSERLKKARLRLAEAQGILPFGASDMPLAELKELKTIPSVSKVREISWRVAEPEVKYDPKYAASKLFAQPFRWLKRNIQIFVPLTLFTFKIIFDILLNREETYRARRAQELLKIISSQSPALIKAGQALSSRSDLLPKEYLEALQNLQDRCPAFPSQQAFALFEEELGVPLEEVFTLESVEPIAAASIGQVYKGHFKDNPQLQVALKIQRPKCEELVAIDLYILRWYASRFQQLFLSVLKRQVDLINIIDDFGDLLYREMDYRAEAVNAQRFAELYANIPNVFVPKIYTQFSSRKILVMEFVPGCRLTDQQQLQQWQLQPTKLVDILVQCSIQQILENGFFHADPHAGNLLALPSGQLCYLDFGMVSYVEKLQRYQILQSVVHLVNRDFASLTELYRVMGFIPKDVDTAPIVRALEVRKVLF
jgi:predicted unusual protein kinase regulating ubiquinone biosynthesis (AarF/ABC1/UbiB family)